MVLGTEHNYRSCFHEIPMEPGFQRSGGLLPDNEKDVTEAGRDIINSSENIENLSIADTDDDGGFEEESSSSPNLSLEEATTGTYPLITPCPELRELSNAVYEDDSCDESEKDFAPLVELSWTEPSLIRTGTVCKTCKGRLHVWCAKFDPNSQETMCAPCAEKDITITLPAFVDSEASTPLPSVHSGHKRIYLNPQSSLRSQARMERSIQCSSENSAMPKVP